jgi:hypothetical protein
MTTVFLFLFIALVFIPFPLLLRGRMRLFWTWNMVGFAAWLGIAEGVCAWITPEHMTLSQHFYRLLESGDAWRGWVILSCFLAGWVCLILHLTWKALTRKKFLD